MAERAYKKPNIKAHAFVGRRDCIKQDQSDVRQQEEEQRFYHDIIGFQGEFLFAESLQAARVMVVSNRGIMPVEGPNSDTYFGATIKRLPLLHGESQITRKYCAFWKKDNSGYYIEDFADILKAMF